MAILFVAAEAFELQPFARLLQNLRKLNWPIAYAYEGVLHDTRMILVANGAGPKLAVKAVGIAYRAVSLTGLSSSRLEAIASVGFCGALNPDLNIGDIVVGSEIFDAARSQTYSCTSVSSDMPFTSGRVLSQDRIANTADEKRELALHGTIAVEMEAAGIAAYAARTGLPCACIKVVSDGANESFPFDLNQMRTADGQIARGKIGLYALKHPLVLSSLLGLKRRSDRVARTLGDFLVSCTISSEAKPTLDE